MYDNSCNEDVGSSDAENEANGRTKSSFGLENDRLLKIKPSIVLRMKRGWIEATDAGSGMNMKSILGPGPTS